MSYTYRRDTIMQYLREHGPSTSRQIADAIGAGLGVVQNALWRMNQSGMVRVRDTRGKTKKGYSCLLRLYSAPDTRYIPMLRPSGYELVRELERERLCAGQSTYS